MNDVRKRKYAGDSSKKSPETARKGNPVTIRQDILDAAAKVFGDRGYERATLEEVAGMVGIQKGSLYYHIESKEQLLLEIHQGLTNELYERMRPRIALAKGDPEAELRAVIHVIVHLIASSRDKVNVVLRDYRALTPKNMGVVLKNRSDLLDMIEGILKRLMAGNGGGRHVSPRTAALGILGMTFWVSEWFDNKRDSPEQISDAFATMALNGLLRR